MIDEKRQELYDITMKRLRNINPCLHNRIEPLDDKAAVILLAEEIENYRQRIKGYEEINYKLKAERKELRKTIIKLVSKMYGDE